jgi:hypothetical protein
MICLSNKLYAQNPMRITVCKIDTTSKYFILIGKDSLDKTIILLVDKNESNRKRIKKVKIKRGFTFVGNEIKINFIQNEPLETLIIDGKEIEIEWGNYKLYSVVSF